MAIVMREIQLRLAAKAWLEQASRRKRASVELMICDAKLASNTTAKISSVQYGAGFQPLAMGTNLTLIPLEVQADGSIEQCGEGVPGWGHSDGDGECYGREDKRRGPHGGAVDSADRDEFVGDENE